MNEKFRIIAQSYCGMTPKDKGCKTWGEMQQKMADEIEEVVKNITSNTVLADVGGECLHPYNAVRKDPITESCSCSICKKEWY